MNKLKIELSVPTEGSSVRLLSAPPAEGLLWHIIVGHWQH